MNVLFIIKSYLSNIFEMKLKFFNFKFIIIIFFF